MELVRSGAGDKVDHAAGRASGLRGIAVGLDGDLLNTFDVRLDADRADDAFVIVDSVDDPVVEGIVLPVDGEAGGVGPAIVGTAAAAEPVAGSFVGAGDQLHQLNEVAAVQGQVLHRFRGHRGAYCRAVSLEQRGLRGHLDDGGLGTELQMYVGTRTVPRLHGEVLGDRLLEAAGLHRNGVVPDR